MSKRRDTKPLSKEEATKKKEAILSALTKASADYLSSKGSDDTLNEPDDYYTLSRDEMEALVNGDIEKIENWVGNMDRKHATRLLRWLIKERW